MITPKYHIFVCTSCRANGTQKGFCHQKDSGKVVEKFIQEIEDRNLSGDCIVTNTAALESAAKGPSPSFIRRVWYAALRRTPWRRLWTNTSKAGRSREIQDIKTAYQAGKGGPLYQNYRRTLSCLDGFSLPKQLTTTLANLLLSAGADTLK
jgi:hypothetical protein